MNGTWLTSFRMLRSVVFGREVFASAKLRIAVMADGENGEAFSNVDFEGLVLGNGSTNLDEILHVVASMSDVKISARWNELSLFESCFSGRYRWGCVVGFPGLSLLALVEEASHADAKQGSKA